MALKGISKREFARRDGCSEKLVRRAVTQGKLVEYGDGSLDPALVGTPWRDRSRDADTAAPVRTDGDEMLSFAEAQRRKENYLAKLRQLEYEIKSGQFLDADEVAKYIGDQFVTFRRAVEGIPSRHGAHMAAVLGCDHHRLDQEMSRVIRETLLALVEPLVKAKA